MAKRVAIIVGSLVMSAGFLWLALRDVPIAEVWASIQAANIWWVMAAVSVGVVGIYTRGIRWRGLVNNQVSLARAFYIVGIMSLLNILPMRLGEVARTVLAARERIPVITAATSIVVERLVDTLFVLLLLMVTVSQVESLPASVAQTAQLLGVLTVVGFAVLMTLARYPQTVRRLMHAITERVPLLSRLPLESLLDHALDGLTPLTDWRRFAHAFGWTVVSWVMSFLVFYFGQLALTTDSPPTVAALSLPLAAFSVALPLTVAALGPFQGAVRIAGEAFGMAEVTATAMGFLVHGVTIAMYVITGIWGLMGLGVALADVMQRPADEQPAQGDHTHE